MGKKGLLIVSLNIDADKENELYLFTVRNRRVV